ncbi:MAG: hypothetical protein H7293_10800, partial [Candidatus Saccharibacteria bacterium]|nr:hypothetical protein [Rhodoferax sp.]
TDADNFSGSLPAVRSDWRFGDADSMSARTTTESTTDAGYTTAGASPKAKLSVSLLPLRGSPYRGRLGRVNTSKGIGDEDDEAGEHHVELVDAIEDAAEALEPALELLDFVSLFMHLEARLRSLVTE